MNLTAEETVAEIVRELPAAARVFEQLGIDYCCGGQRSLEQACNTANVQPYEALAQLQAAERRAHLEHAERKWQEEPLSELIAHIVATHHTYTREEIARLAPLFEKVCAVHGKRHPELEKMREIFQGLSRELMLHMMKEERVLFPYIVRTEEAVIQSEPVLPAAFVTVKNPIGVMQDEHDSAGHALRALREASAGYALPADACSSFKVLYEALQEFEADLHRHIHLENNVLFPRAIAMERP